MKILHIAHGPMQGVPRNFIELECKQGHTSDMVYIQCHAEALDYPIIKVPLLDYYPVRRYRDWKLKQRVIESGRRVAQPNPEDLQIPLKPLMQLPPGPLERVWFPIKDFFIRRRIPQIIRDYKLAGYDVVQFDGAKDLTWNADLAKALKQDGAKIISAFYGTELRVQGVNSALDKLSDLNISVESDHQFLHPNIHLLNMPFELATHLLRHNKSNAEKKPLRIVHAPSDRYNKGTDLILPIIEELKKQFDFEFVLIEGLSQNECRKIKFTCDLCIDHVGNRGGTGYGISSLEMFAMGIPCVADFADYLVKDMPDHPFYLATPQTLKQVLAQILSRPEGLQAKGEEAKMWLQKTHSHAAVAKRMKTLYQSIGLKA